MTTAARQGAPAGTGARSGLNPVQLLGYYGRRGLNKYVRRAARERADLLAMQALLPLSPVYVPWSASAMRPSAVVALLNEVVLNGRRRIVELGSGVSTFYLARLLARVGGHLHTVEHDESWAPLLEQELKAEGLQDVVTVVHAPLAPTAHGWARGDATWYSAEALAGLTRPDSIDLLIVDGPPAYRRDLRHARYPAVPFFTTALAAHSTVVLDDLHRRGEQEILLRWEREFGLSFRRRHLSNIALSHTGPGTFRV